MAQALRLVEVVNGNVQADAKVKGSIATARSDNGGGSYGTEPAAMYIQINLNEPTSQDTTCKMPIEEIRELVSAVGLCLLSDRINTENPVFYRCARFTHA